MAYRLSDNKRSLLNNFANEKYLHWNENKRQKHEHIRILSWREHNATLKILLYFVSVIVSFNNNLPALQTGWN